LSSDYTTATGSVTFAPGIETRTAKVAVIGDTLNEPAERLNLTQAGPATLQVVNVGSTELGWPHDRAVAAKGEPNCAERAT